MVTELGRDEKMPKTFLQENPNIANEIEESIRASSQKDLIPDNVDQDTAEDETQKAE